MAGPWLLLTNSQRDVGLGDLLLAQAAVEVRGDPDGAQRAALGQDVLRVEHGAALTNRAPPRVLSFFSPFLFLAPRSINQSHVEDFAFGCFHSSPRWLRETARADLTCTSSVALLKDEHA
jgi:hypothetical protein